MNPRQRRGVLLMIAAGLGAVAVFVAVVGYLGSVRAEVGTKTEVLRLKQAVPAYSPIDISLFDRVEVPVKWTPPTVITDQAEITGKVAAADLIAGSFLQKGMLVNAPILAAGQREIAIMIDAETGVAGKVHPGMHVDIYATYQVQNGNQQGSSCAARIVSSAQVLLVGQLTEERDARNTTVVNKVVPITFALSAGDSLKLTREESFATKLRLALIGGTDAQNGARTGVRLDPVCQTVPAR